MLRCARAIADQRSIATRRRVPAPKPTEPALETPEAIERAHEAEKIAGRGELIEKLGVVIVALLAAILALASVFGRRSVAELLLTQEQASGAINVAEVNAVKQQINSVTLLMLRVWDADPDMEVAAQQAIVAMEREIDERFQPEEQRLQQQALDLQRERDAAQRRYESYELAETAAQMAIVFTTIAVVARSSRLLLTSAALGTVGFILLIDGFFPFLPIPH
jgi:hypothetical protein